MEMLETVCPHCAAVNRLPGERLKERPNCGRCHEPLFTGSPLHADDAAFSRLLKREQLPVVVDFWAEWCAPCRSFAPVFEQVATEMEPKARFVKVDTEQAQQAASTWSIRSIPTVAVFRGGKLVAQQAGALPRAAFIQWLESVL